jgi:hypothetical protein
MIRDYRLGEYYKFIQVAAGRRNIHATGSVYDNDEAGLQIIDPTINFR